MREGVCREYLCVRPARDGEHLRSGLNSKVSFGPYRSKSSLWGAYIYACMTGQGRCVFVCNAASEKCSHLVGGVCV